MGVFTVKKTSDASDVILSGIMNHGIAELKSFESLRAEFWLFETCWIGISFKMLKNDFENDNAAESHFSCSSDVFWF